MLEGKSFDSLTGKTSGLPINELEEMCISQYVYLYLMACYRPVHRMISNFRKEKLVPLTSVNDLVELTSYRIIQRYCLCRAEVYAIIIDRISLEK